MTTEQIKEINLTHDDFKLLIQGLEGIKCDPLLDDMHGDISIMLSEVLPDSHKQKFRSFMTTRLQEENNRRALLKENIQILYGKLHLFKRYLVENKLISDTYNIINTPPH